MTYCMLFSYIILVMLYYLRNIRQKQRLLLIGNLLCHQRHEQLSVNATNTQACYMRKLYPTIRTKMNILLRDILKQMEKCLSHIMPYYRAVTLYLLDKASDRWEQMFSQNHSRVFVSTNNIVKVNLTIQRLETPVLVS